MWLKKKKFLRATQSWAFPTDCIYILFFKFIYCKLYLFITTALHIKYSKCEVRYILIVVMNNFDIGTNSILITKYARRLYPGTEERNS